MDLNKTDDDLDIKRKSRNLWLALSLGIFIVIVFLVTIAKLSNGNLIEGFDHTLRPSLLKE
tara:strand:- start:246 stop:428 length:183 start_codon:yes stop_codon:yes gene_type:complete